MFLAFWKARHRFAMFAALWGFGVFMAYTLIPYKTPWLALNFLLPIAITAGYGINELAVSRQMWQRAAAAFLAAIAFGVCAYQAIDLNFYRYDDDSMPYVYAHTRRAYNEMLIEIDRIAEKSGKNNETSIIVASPDYWGLPWSLRNYPNAGFYGQITPTSTAEIVIGKTDQQAELEKEYGRHYQSTGTYALRPGVDLVLYVKKDLAK
jgi:predicted membrane-bound mannosyltransferase